MNTEQSQIDILKNYLNLVLSWHKLIVFFLLAAICAGYVVYLKQPKIYQSSASLMYQQQRINPSKMSPDDERNMGEMVNSISQQVMSRSSLERVIREHGLYPAMMENAPIEDVVHRMRRDISVNVERSKGNVFTVSFKGKEPRQTMRVANALAARFIEENLKLREERAMGTTRYIQDELRMSREVLEKKEAKMRDYKLRHYNEMPEQRASNMSRLNSLQEQFESTQRRIHDLEQTRLLVSEQLEARREARRLADGSIDSGSGTAGRRDELSDARRRYQDLLSRYTAEHPAVRRAKNRVEQLEAERSALMAESGGEENLMAAAPQDTRIAELNAQLREIRMNIDTLRSDAESIRGQMEKYQQWIDAAPVREAEWTALTRDYNQLRSYHDNLLAQSLSAEAAESLERRQQGSQFRVVDPAYVPTTPMGGTFVRILFMATGMGLLAGVGLVMGFSMLDTSFKDIREVEALLEVPVTAALPFIVTDAEKRRRRIKNIAWSLFFIVWIGALGAATGYLYLQGEIIL